MCCMILRWKSHWPFLADCGQRGIWVITIHASLKLPHTTRLISVLQWKSVTVQLVCWADSVVSMISYKKQGCIQQVKYNYSWFSQSLCFLCILTDLCFPGGSSSTAAQTDLMYEEKEVWFNLNNRLVSTVSKEIWLWFCMKCLGKRVVLSKRTGKHEGSCIFIKQKQWHQPLDWATSDSPPGYRLKSHKALSAYSCTISVT